MARSAPRSQTPARVCFWCDEAPTRRRPLVVHIHYTDAPCHEKCARAKFRLNEAEAATLLVPWEA